METRQMIPSFLSTFSPLTVCNIYFLHLEMMKIYFHVIHLWSILVYKIPQFWAKAANPDSP